MQFAVIFYPLVGTVVRAVSLCFSPQAWKVRITSCFSRSRKPQEPPILPVTEQRGPRPTFSSRHIAHLRDWEKPVVSPLSVHMHQQAHHPEKLTDIPALAHPDNVYRPQQAYKMTWEQFQERQRNRDPNADEHHRHVRESWKPSPPRNFEYWKKVGEDMEARKGWWEKAKAKFYKRYPQKDRELVF